MPQTSLHVLSYEMRCFCSTNRYMGAWFNCLLYSVFGFWFLVFVFCFFFYCWFSSQFCRQMISYFHGAPTLILKLHILDYTNVRRRSRSSYCHHCPQNNVSISGDWNWHLCQAFCRYRPCSCRGRGTWVCEGSLQERVWPHFGCYGSLPSSWRVDWWVVSCANCQGWARHRCQLHSSLSNLCWSHPSGWRRFQQNPPDTNNSLVFAKDDALLKPYAAECIFFKNKHWNQQSSQCVSTSYPMSDISSLHTQHKKPNNSIIPPLLYTHERAKLNFSVSIYCVTTSICIVPHSLTPASSVIEFQYSSPLWVSLHGMIIETQAWNDTWDSSMESSTAATFLSVAPCTATAILNVQSFKPLKPIPHSSISTCPSVIRAFSFSFSASSPETAVQH